MSVAGTKKTIRKGLLRRGIAAITALACLSIGKSLVDSISLSASADLSAPAVSGSRYPAGNVVFPGNDGKAHSVSYDERSFRIDEEPIVIWSAEVHYWRSPDVDSWRDLFQRMRAGGFNAVSLYFFWGLHQWERDGEFDFTEGTVRDIDLLLRTAEEEGLYVIARPGPYINAEVSMGGLPAYMTNFSGGLRTTDPEVLQASKQWLSAVNGVIKEHLITAGKGSVILYQVENELLAEDEARGEFLRELAGFVKADGIDVPLFHNDWGMGGRFADSEDFGLDFYAYDTYPLGFNCSAGRNELPDLEAKFRRFAPDTPHFITETQGGAFTPWGASYDASDCYDYADEAFTRQWGAMAIGNGMTAFNYYMAFGGTNWGWTGAPASGFTSYDYGSGITEDRAMTGKASVQKETGYYQQAVPEFALMDPVEAPQAVSLSGSSSIKTYQRVSSDPEGSVTGNGVRLLVARLGSSNDVTETTFTMPLSLGAPTENGAQSFSHDDRSEAISFVGGWERISDAPSAEGTLTRSLKKGDTATLRFQGDSVQVIVNTGTDHGEFTVKIDDQPPVSVTRARVETEQNKPVQLVGFSADQLGAGEHTIVVTNAQDAVLDIDAFNVTDAGASQPVVVNNSDRAITYDGTWEHATDRGWTDGDIDGDESFSNTAGASYEFTFTGIGFDLIAPFSQNHGQASVFVDGKAVGKTQEQVTTSAQPQQRVFSWRAKEETPASHEVTVVVDGTPFPGSSGAFVSLDAVRYFPDAASLGQTKPAEGEVFWDRIPQKEDTALALHGRDALILTADKVIAGHDLYYTTSQLFGAPLATETGAVQYVLGATSDPGETVLHYSNRPTVTAPDGVESTWDQDAGQLRLNYHYQAAPVMISITNSEGETLQLRVIDREYAVTTFILAGNRGGESETNHIAIEGAPLARTVHFNASTATITGSMTKPGKLNVIAPSGIKTITWNHGAPASVNNAIATTSAPGPAAITTQTLEFVKAEDNAETRIDYDDSAWTIANHTQAANTNSQGPGSWSKVVLDSNHYQAYEGDVWYRATYTSAQANPTIQVQGNGGSGVPQQGKNPAFLQVWANDTYVGAYPANGTTQQIKISNGVIQKNQKVTLAILVHNLGQNLDWSDDGLSKQNRGLKDANLQSAGPVTWKIKGATKALITSKQLNPSGTIYNNGGLAGEAKGWHTPEYDDSDWAKTNTLHANNPGVTWYRAKANLNIPKNTDPVFRLNINSKHFATRTDYSQATIYVNGWNTGTYIGDIGPQRTFVIPTAFLNLNGNNTIAIAIAAKQPNAGPETITLQATNTMTLPVGDGVESTAKPSQEATVKPDPAPPVLRPGLPKTGD